MEIDEPTRRSLLGHVVLIAWLALALVARGQYTSPRDGRVPSERPAVTVAAAER